MYRILMASLAVLSLFVGQAHAADPDPTEVVIVLYGNEHSYLDLQADFDKQKKIKKHAPFFKGPAEDLRIAAGMNAREIALKESVAREHPSCELEATDEEIDQFVDWWRSYVVSIREKRAASGWKSEPGSELEHWLRLEGFDNSNAQVVETARETIWEWKANRCLYRVYGGGRVNFTPDLTVPGGIALVSKGSRLYPQTTFQGTPLKAYQMHYEAMKREGTLSFGDPAYEEGFFKRYRMTKNLLFHSPEREEKSIEEPFWQIED